MQWNCEPIFILNMSYLLLPLAVGPIFGQCTHNDGETEIASFVFNFVAQIEAAENKHETCVTMLDARMQLHFKVCENAYLHICNQIVLGLGIKREQKLRQIIIFIVWCVCCFNCISGRKIPKILTLAMVTSMCVIFFFYAKQKNVNLCSAMAGGIEQFFFCIRCYLVILCRLHSTCSTHFIYRIDGNR